MGGLCEGLSLMLSAFHVGRDLKKRDTTLSLRKGSMKAQEPFQAENKIIEFFISRSIINKIIFQETKFISTF